MEHGTHHVMVVAGKDANAGSALPVPYADSLVVRGRHNPWIFVMEHRGADVVEVAEKCEDTTFQLVVPHFDLVIVTTRYKEGLLVVEANATDWAIVFVIFFQEGAHAVVP